jgi:hypothetical protein
MPMVEAERWYRGRNRELAACLRIGVTADHIIVRDIDRQKLIPWSSVTGSDLARPSEVTAAS